jgi:hypothetical protein
MVHALDMVLWAKACNTTIYISNKCPHKVLKGKTLSGKIPKLSQVQVFNCPICIHIPREKITKLEPSSLKGVFVYNESSKAYRVHIPS